VIEASPLVVALRVVAVILLLIAAANVPTGRVNLTALGLALFVLSFVLA
jgi:hypothetical protein